MSEILISTHTRYTGIYEYVLIALQQDFEAVLGNVRERQQHHCQEILVAEYFPTKFSHISQEIFVIFVKIVPAKTEVYHHYMSRIARLLNLSAACRKF